MPTGRPRGRAFEPESLAEARERVRNNIRRLRTERGWTQQDAANECRLGFNHYRHIEGGRAGLTLRTLCSLAEGFGVDVSELLAPVEDEKPS